MQMTLSTKRKLTTTRGGNMFPSGSIVLLDSGYLWLTLLYYQFFLAKWHKRVGAENSFELECSEYNTYYSDTSTSYMCHWGMCVISERLPFGPSDKQCLLQL